ncbi:MAG: RNA polymerase sigma factor [Myxococcales bacterium]
MTYPGPPIERGSAEPNVERQPLAVVANAEFQFIWRSLRRLGVWPHDVVDDAAQRVFEIATLKWDRVEPGKERAYLYRIAVLVAAEKRRARRVGQREAPDEIAIAEANAEGVAPDDLFQERQRRALLDTVLDGLSDDLREVFVLYEIERMSCVEISELLDVKLGTVSSRLRRAREAFQEGSTRLRKRLESKGVKP